MSSPPVRRFPAPLLGPAAKRQRLVHITDLKCVLCGVRCNDERSLTRHLASAQHRQHLLGGASDAAAAAPAPTPSFRFDPATALSQLIHVVQVMYSTFAPQTVHVMYQQRTRRLANTVVSEAVRLATNPAAYCALVLSAPTLLCQLSQAARDRLACADQREITLTIDDRRKLQHDCLYRRLFGTTVGHHHALCYELARACVACDLAPALLSDHHEQRWLLQVIALGAEASVREPDSDYHWLHHYQPRPASLTRRRSLSDLRVSACDCTSDSTTLSTELELIVDRMRGLDTPASTLGDFDPLGLDDPQEDDNMDGDDLQEEAGGD